MKRLRGSVVAGALGLLVLAWQAPASAAGFATQTFGGEHGNVVDTNPTALYYNPGALGFSSDTAIGMYASLAAHSLTWTHQLATRDQVPDPPDAQGADTGKATLFNVFGGASIGGTTHLTKNLVVGAGFFAPFFGLAHWNKNNSFGNLSTYPAVVDGVQRWFSIDGKIEVLYFSAGASYKLGPLSLGATGNFISSTFSTYQARNTGSNGLPSVLPSAEGRAYFDVQGYNGSFAAGAMLEALPKQLFIGASYQAQPGLGPQALNGDLYITPPGMQASHNLVTLHQSLPDIIRGGVKFRTKDGGWEFRVFGDYTRWSQLQNQCVTERGTACNINPTTGAAASSSALIWANLRRDWNDTWGVRVGASRYLNQTVEVFAGAGFETAAVPDATMAPDIPDADNILLAVGGRFALTEMLFFTASYTHIQYLNRNVDPNSSTLTTAANGNVWVYPTVEENGGGLYTQWAGFLSGNLEAMF